MLSIAPKEKAAEHREVMDHFEQYEEATTNGGKRVALLKMITVAKRHNFAFEVEVAGHLLREVVG